METINVNVLRRNQPSLKATRKQTNHREPNKSSKRVAILVDDGLALFELGCAVELFALPRPEIPNWFQTDVVSFNPAMLNATGGLQVQAKTVSCLSNYDLLVIPSWPVDRPVFGDIKRAVIDFFNSGGKVVSFCSGAFLLGEVGLLDGRRAITHWRYANEFKQRFPYTEYVDDVLYLYDGQIGCSAGSSAGIDLGIEVIRAEYGYQVANQVARRLVLAAHRSGGQSQFVETPVPKIQNHFSETLDWAIQNIDSPLQVNQLSGKANMSRRTFDRHFRKTLNMSPKEWLIQQRLERAKSLLENSSQDIDNVAYNSGFETPIAMRHNFRKYLKISPSNYRKQFFSGASVSL
jgi:AraC family transcriptional activator FtrA